MAPLHELLTPPLLLAVAVAAAAGVIRGITGFGGAMVMTPPLALIFGPKLAVPVVLLLETFAATPMLREAVATARWRMITPMFVAACLTVPLGGYLLVSADPDVLRRAIAVIVIVFSLLLLNGVRYSGPQHLSTSIALGGVSGTMLGATSIGAPPVILYLLSGPDAVRDNACQPDALRGCDFRGGFGDVVVPGVTGQGEPALGPGTRPVFLRWCGRWQPVVLALQRFALPPVHASADDRRVAWRAAGVVSRTGLAYG